MDPTGLDELRQHFDAARAQWPDIVVDFESFAARAAGIASVEARDLYLACACGRGDERALAEFDRRYLAVAHGAIARIDAAPDFIAEVQQVLRERLFAAPDRKIDDYRGDGSLAGWVRTAAVRVALNLRRAANRKSEQSAVENLDTMLTPELAIIKEHCQSELQEALQRAVGRLEPHDRLMLRFYYVDGMTHAKIAAVQRVSPSTIFRRLAAITQTVLAEVTTDLTARLRLSTESVDSLIREAQEHLNISLHRLLRSG
jgi:RNA polymerase sigma-70 factor (ECF subfamily)